MRRWMRILVVSAAAGTLPGCTWLCGDVVPRASVRELKGQLDSILPQYRAYVEADAAIQPVTKRTRLRDADQAARLAAKAAEATDE